MSRLIGGEVLSHCPEWQLRKTRFHSNEIATCPCIAKAGFQRAAVKIAPAQAFGLVQRYME